MNNLGNSNYKFCQEVVAAAGQLRNKKEKGRGGGEKEESGEEKEGKKEIPGGGAKTHNHKLQIYIFGPSLHTHRNICG